MMEQPCRSCGKPSTRKCSGCKIVTAWYCSSECQKSHWVVHIFECNPLRAITSADHLARAVDKFHIPGDLQTCIEFGFDRIATLDDMGNLLGLYGHLLQKLGVSTKKIQIWRSTGVLVQEIQSRLDVIPEDLASWFMMNQYVFNHSLFSEVSPADVILQPAFDYAGIPRSTTKDERSAIFATWPEKKTSCMMACVTILSLRSPHTCDTIWIHLGYIACPDKVLEEKLTYLYNKLLGSCSFEQFWQAYNTQSIVALFDKCGYEAERKLFPHLEEVLGVEYLDELKSVWLLKFWINSAHMGIENLIPVMVDYGFANCTTEQQRQELKAVYQVYFTEKNGDPIALHNATMQGRLFRHFENIIKLSKKFKRLMKNPHPL